MIHLLWHTGDQSGFICGSYLPNIVIDFQYDIIRYFVGTKSQQQEKPIIPREAIYFPLTVFFQRRIYYSLSFTYPASRFSLSIYVRVQLSTQLNAQPQYNKHKVLTSKTNDYSGGFYPRLKPIPRERYHRLPSFDS